MLFRSTLVMKRGLIQLLPEDFTHSFKGADQLIIAQLYGANQQQIDNISSQTLCQKIIDSGFRNAIYIREFEDILNHLGKTVQKGDAVAFLSAGNLTDTAHNFAKQLEEHNQ